MFCQPTRIDRAHPSRLIAVGVDGARGGWMTATLHEHARGRRHTALALLPSIDAIAALGATTSAPVAIDMPIGLPERVGARTCEHQARARLPGRTSTIFPTPSRMLVDAPTYADARARIAQMRETEPDARSISAQAFHLLPKIRQLDAFVQSRPDAHEWLFEVHPELSFAMLTPGNAPIPHAKKTPAGRAARIALLEHSFPDLARTLAAATFRRTEAAPDDVLDAFACLTTALRIARGGGTHLGGGETDSLGIPMRIVV